MFSFCPKKNTQSGFSLLELILAIAIFSIGSYAMATMLIDSNISTRLTLDRTEALLYAKEGVLAVKSIRDSNWDLLSDGEYGLAGASDDAWELSGTSDLINEKYTRVLNISDSETSSSIKDVLVTISWNLTTDREVSIALNTILTDWATTTASSTPI